MKESFAEKLRQLRADRGLSQQQLANRMFVDRSSIARWESGARMPDIVLLTRLAKCLGVEAADLISGDAGNARAPRVILVDDEKPILAGELRVLERALAGAEIAGFTKPSEALEYARSYPVNLAFLDIELGRMSGFELCDRLVKLNPSTNVVYLTAWPNHSLKAWETNACGFLLKPPIEEDIRAMLKKLRHPIPNFAGGGGSSCETDWI